MKKAFIVILAILIPVAAWAGYNQTNPKNHITTINDLNDKSVSFEPLLRIGWVKNEAYLDQVKYKIKNLSPSYTITIEKVNVLNSGGSVVWTKSPNQSIKKKETKENEWRGSSVKNCKINRAGAKLEFQIDCGGKTWCLNWDPAVGGSASTSVSAGSCQ
ncbi:MAG: hypothetical protein JW914_10635 [Syntrophaceae bacterium]|nr:hypothetical protein [Syntrophaceae bacterium]